MCACGALDPPDHLLGECPDSFTVKLRQDAIAATRLEFAFEDDIAHAVLDALFEVLSEPQGANLLRGIWIPQQIEALRSKLHTTI